MSTTFWVLSAAIYILPHLTPATSWAGATISMLTEETNSQRSCQLLQNTRLKQSYIRIWVQGNQCVYKLCHITLRRVKEKSPGSWREEEVDQVKLRTRSCGFTSPVCQALPSSRGVMGRIRTMEIQDRRDRTCPSDPFQLQHSLTEIPPLARSLSNLKSWDLSGPWVELTSVSSHRCEVREECQIHTPYEGWLWGSLCKEGVVEKGQSQKDEIFYLHKAQSETPSPGEDRRPGRNFLQALLSCSLHTVTSFTGLIWLTK